MHETVAHSAVSDALVKFAIGDLPATGAGAIAAARYALAEAREAIKNSDERRRELLALMDAQGGSSDDVRVRAWTFGALLATKTPPSVATPVLAAVIAFGEKLGASDEAIAAAAAVGLEAATRILSAIDSVEYRARWNVASSIGGLGATLAVARLLGLDALRARHALGVAATQAAGLARNAGTSMEAVEVGKAAADSIEAALLARHGFTSAPASIDGRRGLAALMAYRFDAGNIADGLGVRWTSFAASAK